jgi:hypothetical protein
MKQVVLFLFALVASVSHGQELSIDRKDEFTGEIVRKTEYYEIGDAINHGKLYAAAVRIGDIVFLELFTTAEQGCVGGISNYVQFLFDDGKTLKNSEDQADIDCKDKASAYYVFNKTQFVGKRVRKIRYAMTEGYVDYEWNGDFQIVDLLGAVQ